MLLLDDRHLARFRLPRRRALTPPPPSRWRLAAVGLVLVAVGWATLAELPGVPLPAPLTAPARALAPFRIANAYGLFAVMTRERYEIEFQGTVDGARWVAYPFRFKPQDPWRAPGIYAPYQPRFDWNLWFASLAPWQQNPWVVHTEELLRRSDPAVLALFAGDPFAGRRPRAVRTVLWRYRFTDAATRRRTGRWWNRELLGAFAPPVGEAGAGPTLAVNPPRGAPPG